jgi:carboxymethylenebutenolidase
MDSNEIDELVHLYVDGAFNRRELWNRVAAVTGSAAAATSALVSLGIPETASAQTTGSCADPRVPADAPDVEGVFTDFPGDAGRLFGYLALPRKPFTSQMPAILVIHENRGLNEHIKDVTRRFARAGYVGLGIDLLSRQGGTDLFPDPADAMRAYNTVTPSDAVADMKSAVAYLRTLGVVNANRIGCIGFCAGGGNSFNLAVSQPDLSAAVVYYGAPPAPLDLLDNLNAPLLMHYAQLDKNFSSRVPATVTALLDKNKPFSLHIYEGVGHAFNNDTGASYNAAVACEAWNKTLDFYARTLRRPD